MNYPIPAKTAISELEVKKSRFIGIASHADSRDAALTILEKIRADYPDARHHCWAYQLGHPDTPTSAAMGDDGEPSGTAGKPILNVIQHKDVSDVMVVVVRYFGGIKLGAGGLVRAYSGAAQAAMADLAIKHHVSLTALSIVSDFRHEQFIRHFADTHQGQISDVVYTDNVALTLHLPDEATDPFETSIGALNIQVRRATE
ncbi:YigZ family protein [Alteromonas halophila]|uniref:YigZ family protein n=1 Tax=Alteromonas halophila TaxID=516698 RepID=A0A918MX47_9ALTE|nr:YigZ family protein [Alteromonas halophila]GGW81377.1 hypothetical protein GCM10007391_13190 [Alteromonas halophila]